MMPRMHTGAMVKHDAAHEDGRASGQHRRTPRSKTALLMKRKVEFMDKQADGDSIMERQGERMDRHNRQVKTAAKLLLDYMLQHRDALNATLPSKAMLPDEPPKQQSTQPRKRQDEIPGQSDHQISEDVSVMAEHDQGNAPPLLPSESV